MNKKAVEQLSEAVTTLRANGFENLSEAAIFCAAANATVNDRLVGISDLSRASDIPMSSASRYVWLLHERGLLEYTTRSGDRRLKLMRARLDALNAPKSDS
jgi:DNA-binding IclR family transcriptional regulator